MGDIGAYIIVEILSDLVSPFYGDFKTPAVVLADVRLRRCGSENG